MAFRRLLVDRVLVVAWRAPELEDLESLTDQLYDASTRRGGRLLYLSIFGPGPLPQGNMSDALVDFYRSVLSFCDSMHIVMEGHQFEMSLKRSVLANALLGQGGARIFIESSLERAQATAPVLVQREIEAAIERATHERLFDFAKSQPPQALGS